MDKPKLLDQLRDAIRVKHYSMRTEEAYVPWIKRFIFRTCKIISKCRKGICLAIGISCFQSLY